MKLCTASTAVTLELITSRPYVERDIRNDTNEAGTNVHLSYRMLEIIKYRGLMRWRLFALGCSSSNTSNLSADRSRPRNLLIRDWRANQRKLNLFPAGNQKRELETKSSLFEWNSVVGFVIPTHLPWLFLHFITIIIAGWSLGKDTLIATTEWRACLKINSSKPFKGQGATASTAATHLLSDRKPLGQLVWLSEHS